jgi:hypothetical protein
VSESEQTVEEMAAISMSGWGLAYGRFAAVIREEGLQRGVEVGVAFGGHSESILEIETVEMLWAIDPFLHQGDYDDPINVEQERFDRIHAFTSERLARFGARAMLLRMSSEEAVAVVPDDIDFVYVDAIHTLDAVWDDLWRWAPKIRPGGILGGHDYGHPDFPGVKQAIDTFSSRTGWPVHELGETVWWMPRGAELPRSPGERPRLAAERTTRIRPRDVVRRVLRR